MKNVLRLLVFAALVTVFALPSYAQDAAGQTPAANPCTADADAKNALYQKFLASYKGSAEQQKSAYETGKEYLGKYGACTDDADTKINSFIKNWVTKYEKAIVEFNCKKAANETPAQAFEACQQWITADRENLRPHLALVSAGIKANLNNDKSLNARAATEARTALSLIEAGKTADEWAPFSSQQDAAAGLRYYIAAWTYDSNPAEAATQLLTVAQSNSSIAKEPATYQLLGAAIYNSDVKKLYDEYKGKCEGKEASTECDVLLNKVNYALDRVIDAYARTVALSNGNPKYAATATAIRPLLTTLYKQRHDGAEAGLNELIGGVLNKPLPLPGQEPPLPTPSTTGADGTGDGVKSTTNGTATTPASGTTAKPAATPTPAPKPAAQKPPRS